MSLGILQRPRRNRRSVNLRRLVRETRVLKEDLIWPLFVHAGTDDQPVVSMPGVSRLSMNSLISACGKALELGIPAVAIFPCIDSSLKDADGSHALAVENLLYNAVHGIKKRFPELLVITDVALDPYTSHGHDGLLSIDGKSVDNDATIEILCRLAIQEAAAGADIVAPSDMMDGRIGEIRQALDEAGFQDTALCRMRRSIALRITARFAMRWAAKSERIRLAKPPTKWIPPIVLNHCAKLPSTWKKGRTS